MLKLKLVVLTAVLAALGLAPAANAIVSVTLATGSSTYHPGDTITLNAYVTANDWEIDLTAYGAVIYPTAAVTPGSLQQNALPGNWTLGSLNCSAPRCEAFSQISEEGPVPINAEDFQISTLSFHVLESAPLGVYSFDWQTTPASQRLDFFGLTSAPGASFTVVPEPTSAALLGAGLLGLGLARRRRT